MTDHSHLVTLSASKIARWLGVIAILLVLAHVAGQSTKYLTGHDSVYGLIPLFDLDDEANIPSFFSSGLLLFAALLLGIIACLKKSSRDPDARFWTILAFGFLYLAIDEAASIHEKWSPVVKQLLGESVPRFSWVIPGAVLCLIFFSTFFRFWLRLPATTRWLFFAAAFFLVGGGLGIEYLGSRYAKVHGQANLTYHVFVTFEEGSEMAGSILFIYALMNYLGRHYGKVALSFGTPNAPTTPTSAQLYRVRQTEQEAVAN